MPPIETIVSQLPRFREAAESLRNSMLSDLVMIGEIPAPTFGEEQRVRHIVNRFTENGLRACSVDEKGNATGLLPGTEGRQNILMAAHVDTIVSRAVDQTIELTADRLVGPFVGDNCIALAALTILPALLEKLDIRLKSNLVLLASTRAMGRGNLEGLKFFLANSPMPFLAGLCLEGVQLGRLNYSCMGMARGEIRCRLPDNFNWAQFGAIGSIIPMSDVVNRISRIPLPRRPLTTIIMGSIHGGIAFNNIARETTLCFESRSESVDMLNQLAQQIEDITEEVAAQTGTTITLDVFARREPGGIDIAHPLVRHARAMLTALGIPPVLYATTSDLSALRDAKIPALTLGLTTGERKRELDEIDESVAISPLSTGLAQLAGVLLSMDEGFGHEGTPVV